ncbi:MAG: DUF1801 domain-containing protein [Bacteroidia bacterium]|nr:DUF1801 domain-containing protein [Bacteroidia bacterium]
MTDFTLNPQVDKYLIDGCMRCKYGATPQCKVVPFREELELLRQLVLESGLTEEIKWGAPVYTLDDKNIISVNALKHSANIGFFKGVLLKDKHKLLQQQGNIQSGRIIKFTNKSEIEPLIPVLKSYILEAIEVEKKGEKVEYIKNPEPIPDELTEEFENDVAFKQAFYALTAGRQRGYIIHFSKAKQSATRKAQILKYKDQIMNGIGIHDLYKTKK